MNEGRTVFAQLVDFLPKYEFDKCAQRYRANFRVRCLSAYEQFLVMAFAQLIWRESLRDIETCLRALGPKLYHSGIRRAVARSTLADANERRDWRLFADFAQVPWARFSRSRGGVKLHTLFRLRGSFPTVVVLTAARVHDVNFLDQLSYEPGCFYIMDKAYVDFQRLCRLHQSGAFFVTRPFRSFRARRLYSRPVDKTSGVLFDQTVVLIHFYAHKAYSEPMRRVGFRDPQTGRKFIFLTNNFIEPALTIAQLYRCRWQVELFFKWIKQHLRIKAFYGLSENAVRTQIWIAMSVYLLVAIVKKRLHLDASLYTILQIASVTLFEKTPISQALSQQWPCPEQSNMQNQQCLPGF